jgi:mannan endo-1,4-beta-mannosidase
MSRSRPVALAAAVLLFLGLLTASGPPASAGGRHFVTRDGSTLRLDGRPFRFAGTNTYYLMYGSQLMVDDVFSRVKAAQFPVLRTSGWLDIGNQDGTDSVGPGKVNGGYFQYWDGTKPAYNDGADGLSKLDYVVARAGQEGVKLVIPLTNNWTDFGGMDQYVRWAGGSHHDDFYTDPTIRGWYQAWISHLLNHVNTLTGVAYKEDPTIMTWELGNEPRCQGSGAYPTSTSCTAATLTSWADTMSRYIKGVDRHHLVSVGDEGFYCSDPGGPDWTTNCAEGVDSVALTKLPAIDVMSFHLSHKASMLGEYGLKDRATRNTVYRDWTRAAVESGVGGLLYWMLAGLQDDGTFYPDYDGVTVYCPSPVCQAITNVELTLRTGRRYFPPVADNDAVTTDFDTPATLALPANDIAYLGAEVKADTVDLDPATTGRQTALTVAGGQFTVDGTGTVTFTPADGYHGRATASYTVRDSYGGLSNVATVTVTVKPNPAAAILISSFEDGLAGWAPGNWQANAGPVGQVGPQVRPAYRCRLRYLDRHRAPGRALVHLVPGHVRLGTAGHDDHVRRGAEHVVQL